MLGVGLMDFISPQQRVVSPDAPILVSCEGESEVQDAKIYNIIFRNLTPEFCLFLVEVLVNYTKPFVY